MNSTRPDVGLACLAFAALGPLGGIATAHFFGVLELPVGAMITALTIVFCTYVGWLSCKTRHHYLALVGLCIGGGVLNGGILGGFCYRLEGVYVGVMFGVIASIAFLAAILHLAVCLRRLPTARLGSLVDRMHRRAVVGSLATSLGIAACLLRLHGAGPPLVIVASAILALILILNGVASLQITRLGRIVPLCGVTLKPLGTRDRNFVDLGIGEQSYELAVGDATLRGAPHITTMLQGDVSGATRAVRVLLVIDAVSLVVMAAMVRFS